MNKNIWQKQVEAYFDGEREHAGNAAQLIAERPECAVYYERLKALRPDANTAGQDGISDAQFPAFMAGIRSEIEGDAFSGWGFRTRGWLAVASVTAAALVFVFAAFVIFATFTGGPAPVQANEIEHVSTELEGATVEWYDDEQGGTTLWISVSEDDVW